MSVSGIARVIMSVSGIARVIMSVSGIARVFFDRRGHSIRDNLKISDQCLEHSELR